MTEPILHRNLSREPPSKIVQARFPIGEFPCAICVEGFLPGRANNATELYWEHQHDVPRFGARQGCNRFGRGPHLGAAVRLGSVSLALGVIVSPQRWHAVWLRARAQRARPEFMCACPTRQLGWATGHCEGCGGHVTQAVWEASYKPGDGAKLALGVPLT